MNQNISPPHTMYAHKVYRGLISSIYGFNQWKRVNEATTHLLQVFVTVDKLALMWVLEFVCLDVLPQGLNDNRSGLSVDPQHTGQTGVQLKLRGLEWPK